MTKHELILNYIKQFRDLGAENCFANGMCYQFARILQDRFGNYGTIILYDEVINHFALFIDKHIYDITGDITDNSDYHWKFWPALGDPALSRRIVRDCVYKLPPDVITCELCSHCFYDEILCNCLCDLDNQPVKAHTPCNKIQKEET